MVRLSAVNISSQRDNAFKYEVSFVTLRTTPYPHFFVVIPHTQNMKWHFLLPNIALAFIPNKHVRFNRVSDNLSGGKSGGISRYIHQKLRSNSPASEEETEVQEASSNNIRFGYVGIIGAPNMGKSTLLNALLEENLCITTSKPQTTRHAILGILTSEEQKCQLAFLDTPGKDFSLCAILIMFVVMIGVCHFYIASLLFVI